MQRARVSALSAVFLSCCIAAVPTTCFGSQSPSLDRRLVGGKTVASEIRRGETAALSCAMKSAANYQLFVDCINGEGHSYLPTDAFLLGLFVNAAATGERLMKESAWLPIWRAEVTRIMRAHQLSDSDLCAALVLACDNIKRLTSGHE